MSKSRNKKEPSRHGDYIRSDTITTSSENESDEAPATLSPPKTKASKKKSIPASPTHKTKKTSKEMRSIKRQRRTKDDESDGDEDGDGSAPDRDLAADSDMARKHRRTTKESSSLKRESATAPHRPPPPKRKTEVDAVSDDDDSPPPDDDSDDPDYEEDGEDDDEDDDGDDVDSNLGSGGEASPVVEEPKRQSKQKSVPKGRTLPSPSKPRSRAKKDADFDDSDEKSMHWDKKYLYPIIHHMIKKYQVLSEREVHLAPALKEVGLLDDDMPKEKKDRRIRSIRNKFQSLKRFHRAMKKIRTSGWSGTEPIPAERWKDLVDAEQKSSDKLAIEHFRGVDDVFRVDTEVAYLNETLIQYKCEKRFDTQQDTNDAEEIMARETAAADASKVEPQPAAQQSAPPQAAQQSAPPQPPPDNKKSQEPAPDISAALPHLMTAMAKLATIEEARYQESKEKAEKEASIMSLKRLVVTKFVKGSREYFELRKFLSEETCAILDETVQEIYVANAPDLPGAVVEAFAAAGVEIRPVTNVDDNGNEKFSGNFELVKKG